MKPQEHIDFSNKQVIGVTWLGALTNLFLAIMKGIVGVVANSSAMVADAGHSLSDLLSDGVALWAISMARTPKDESHPYGHGKFETIGTFFVSILLILTGIGIAVHAFDHVQNPQFPGKLALWAAVLSILVKEGMYHITVSVGKKAGSRILIANAWHHRSDAVSSVAAFIGIGAAQFGFPILDPLAGMLVSGLIIKTGVDMAYDSIRELTDESAEEKVLQNINRLLKQVEGVQHYHAVRARKMGPYILVDMHVEVDSMMSVSAAHQVAERVRFSILNNIPAVNEVLVHVDAEDDAEDQPTELIRSQPTELMRSQPEIEGDIRKVVKGIPEILEISHIICHYLNQHLSVQVEIVVDSTLRISQVQKIAKEARHLIEQIPDINTADIHLELEDEYK